MASLFKYKKTLVLIVITFALIFSINSTFRQRNEVSLPEKAVGYIMMPFQKVFNYAYIKTHDIFTFFNGISTLRQTNEELLNNVQILEYQVSQIENFKVENQRLKDMLNLKQEYGNFEFVAAQIIGRTAENWNNVILINKGSKHGLEVNLAVISHNKGLVGRIIDVGPNWSKIMLITDPNSSIAAMVSRTRDLGVISGNVTTDKNELVKLKYLLPDTHIVTDDTVITSGYGGIYSKGLLIGNVKELEEDENNLIKYAYVLPATNFRTLEEVLVIKSIKQ